MSAMWRVVKSATGMHRMRVVGSVVNAIDRE